MLTRSSGALVDLETLSDRTDELSAAFSTATPFPHLVVDDVLRVPADELLPAFPGPDWPHWHRFEDSYQAGKMFCQDIAAIPEPLAAVIRELSQPPFLEWLERVSGVEGLIPDPYLEGGGLHCTGQGGILAPHTDFHLYPRLDLYRQVNVLVYLNPEWSQEDGGCLELWEKGASAPAKTVVPAWGRCVVFRTDDRSVHGFSSPIARPGLWRRSIALYYYTAVENESFAGDTTTHWQEHGEHGRIGRIRLGLYRTLLLGSRGLAMLAHRANPNLGFRRRRPS